MRQYLELCERILKEGVVKKDRTGTGTMSVFGHQMRFDLSKGFPLMTTKDMSEKRLNGIIEELLWFLDGDTNLSTLLEKGVNIWTPDAYRDAKSKGFQGTKEEFVEDVKFGSYDLGRIYGAQWRSWRGAGGEDIDQIANAIESLKNDPDSRRHIVTAWNPAEIDDMVLPPCHTFFQHYVANGKLSCQMYQRSADVFLGLPFNIASYSLLTMMIADQLGLGYGEFVHTLGDAHIYLNHIEQVKLQLTREPKELPKMVINTRKSIFNYRRIDFVLTGYESHPPIKGDVSVG